MKSKRIIVLLFLLLALTLTLVACNDGKPEAETGEKIVTLVIQNAEGQKTVISDDTNASYVSDWLIELNAEGKITLAYTTSQYGMNISSLNSITVNGSTTFFGFFANDADNVNSAWGTYVYLEQTLSSCSYGQSSMPVKNGCTYALVYTVYEA